MAFDATDNLWVSDTGNAGYKTIRYVAGRDLASVRKSRRAESAIALETMAQAQERFFSRFRTYTSVVTGADGCAGQACGLQQQSALTENEYYQLASNGNATSFTVTATAKNEQLKDYDCRTMTVNNVSVKSGTSSSGADTTDECW